MVYAARLQRVASWDHMCQPKVGRSGLGGYSWFGCCGSHSDGGLPSEVVVLDWSEHLRILTAFCQFLLAWLPLCTWTQPVGLLDSAHFVVRPAVWRGYLFAFPRLEAGGSRR